MSRAKPSWLGSRRLLAIAAVAMFVHALLPPGRTHAWTRLLRGPLEIVVQPVQRPIELLAARLRRPAAPVISDDPKVVKLQELLDLYSLELQQRNDEVLRWKRQVEELQRGLRVSPDLPVIQIQAPVVGGGSDHSSSVLKVRAGRRKGISEYNAVAVVQGVYLVGRVRKAAAPFYDVLPITDRQGGMIKGVVMMDDTTRGPSCALVPRGDGSLRGDVEMPERSIEPPPLKVGMTVRLQDDGWPQHAQGLVIGVIEKVESKPTQSLRPVITVRPTIRIDRVTEVVLRVLGDVSDEEPDEKPGGRT